MPGEKGAGVWIQSVLVFGSLGDFALGREKPLEILCLISLAFLSTQGMLVLVSSVYGRYHRRGDGKTAQSTDKGGASAHRTSGVFFFMTF